MTGRPEILLIDGREVPLVVRRDRRAKRLILRVDPETGAAMVTIPWNAGKIEAQAMALRMQGWIAARLKRIPPKVAFGDGGEIPLLGEPHRIRHAPAARGGVWRDGAEIVVTGGLEHLPRRLVDWLKKEAKREIAERVRVKSLLLGRKAGRITVRDTKSRWGSCTAAGDLNFSWRLVLAPPFVLDYLVAHEVAHLKVKDHGPRFWRTVAELCPEADAARSWLKRHGQGLHRYG